MQILARQKHLSGIDILFQGAAGGIFEDPAQVIAVMMYFFRNLFHCEGGPSDWHLYR